MSQIKWLLVLLFLSGCASIPPPVCSPTRDDSGRIARSRTAVNDFKRVNPCPATGKPSGSCPGYVVDHIKPLCACGADTISNMQWQTVTDGKLKDREERRICGKGWNQDTD